MYLVLTCFHSIGTSVSASKGHCTHGPQATEFAAFLTDQTSLEDCRFVTLMNCHQGEREREKEKQGERETGRERKRETKRQANKLGIKSVCQLVRV